MAILCGEVLNIKSYTGAFFLGLKVKKKKGPGRFQCTVTDCGQAPSRVYHLSKPNPQAKACVFGNSQKPFAYKLYEFQTCVNSEWITDESIIYVLRNNS